MKKINLLAVLCLSFNMLLAQAPKKPISLSLIIDSTPLSEPLPDTIFASFVPMEIRPWYEPVIAVKLKNDAKWKMEEAEPINFYIGIPVNNKYKQWTLEPGDSIVAYY